MKPEIQTVTLNRKSEAELTAGIQELEARGYELVKRGASNHERKVFSYRERRIGQPLTFRGSETINKHTAVMRREYHREVAK